MSTVTADESSGRGQAGGRLVLAFSFSMNLHLASYALAGQPGSPFKGSIVVEAILRAGLLPVHPGLSVIAVPVLTKESASVAQKVRDCIEDALGREVEWAPIENADASASSIDRVTQTLLDLVQDGDQVFVEVTNGLRSISLGLLAGALYLRALRQDVTVLPLWYGEWSKEAGGTLHKAPHLLNLVDWARDAHAFADGLVAGPLLQRLSEPLRQTHPLQRLEGALSATQVPQVLAALRGGALKPLPHLSPVDAAAHAMVASHLASLETSARCTQPDHLNATWLEAELQLAERLLGAGRKGDAARVLREWCVNVVLLAQQGDAAKTTGWFRPKHRHQAEAWIGARVGGRTATTPDAMTDFVAAARAASDLRNELSHERLPAR